MLTIVALLTTVIGPVLASHADEPSAATRERFEYLSSHGTSNCSAPFLEAIPSMPATTMLQGSCCSPMDLHRYTEQVERLKEYAQMTEIPRDPYDVPAGLAARLLVAYDIELSPAEQAEYDLAMQKSEEQGPCCCKCWRWHVFGGLGKLLIRTYGFTGGQVAKVWDLSNGCGGGAEHHHS